MSPRILGIVTLAVTAVLSGTACQGGGRPVAVGEDLRVAGTEMAFSPQQLTTTPGRHRIIFTNEGAARHELAVASPGGTVLGARSIPEGQTVMFDITFADSGVYRLVCREPGHTAAGMVGSVTVPG